VGFSMGKGSFFPS
jgi:hypothetical protein